MKIINAWICQLRNGNIIPVFGNLEIKNGKIDSIMVKDFDITNLEKNHSEEIIDARGRVLTIPNVNFHDHIYSRLAKGLDIDSDMSTFPNILKNLWWKLDTLLDHNMIKASAQIAALDSIRNGVTYIIDHHSSPHCARNSLNTISLQLEKFKLRNILCFETSDRNGKQIKDDGIDENLRFLNNYSTADSQSLLGLHASFTLSNDSLEAAEELVKECYWGTHAHLCEDISDVDITMQNFSKRPMQRFYDYNLLNKKSIVAHGIHLNKDDFNLLRKSGAALVFNIDSNMNNSVGLQKFDQIPNNIPILIGSDGMHSNIARAVKELFLQVRHAGLSFEVAFRFIQKLYIDQHEFIKRFFTDFTSLQVGDRADFIIWDYVPPTPISKNNFWGHYIYGILERPVKTVFQYGQPLLDNFQLLNIDEEKILHDIFSQGERLSNKFNKD